MSEIIEGVEGTWEQRDSYIVQNGERYRLSGTWHDYQGQSLDFNFAFKPGVVVLDEGDVLEVFVPAVEKITLPTKEGVYADRDGDLWLHQDQDWKFLSGEAQYSPEYYAPFRKIAPLYGNFPEA